MLGKKLLRCVRRDGVDGWRARRPRTSLRYQDGDGRGWVRSSTRPRIASRRTTGNVQGYSRESNTVVNVLLKELEAFNGVVIFATNLAVNFDPAFERRIRTHVLFEMPGVEEREAIWKVQVHPVKTPLADA